MIFKRAQSVASVYACACARVLCGVNSPRSPTLFNDTCVRVIHQKCQSIWSIAYTHTSTQATATFSPSFRRTQKTVPPTLSKKENKLWAMNPCSHPSSHSEGYFAIFTAHLVSHRLHRKFRRMRREHVANINYPHYPLQQQHRQNDGFDSLWFMGTHKIRMRVFLRRFNVCGVLFIIIIIGTEHKFVYDNDEDDDGDDDVCKYAWENVLIYARLRLFSTLLAYVTRCYYNDFVGCLPVSEFTTISLFDAVYVSICASNI